MILNFLGASGGKRGTAQCHSDFIYSLILFLVLFEVKRLE
jgi:hypothetical protein